MIFTDTEDLQAKYDDGDLGGGGATTSANGVTYPTTQTDDFAVGGDTCSGSAVCIDASTGDITSSVPGGRITTTPHSTNPGGISIDEPSGIAGGNYTSIEGTTAGFAANYRCVVEADGGLAPALGCPFAEAGGGGAAPVIWNGSLDDELVAGDLNGDGAILSETFSVGGGFTVVAGALTTVIAGTYQIDQHITASWDRTTANACVQMKLYIDPAGSAPFDHGIVYNDRTADPQGTLTSLNGDVRGATYVIALNLGATLQWYYSNNCGNSPGPIRFNPDSNTITLRRLY